MIVDLIVKDLSDNIVVSAKNFGTLSPCIVNIKNVHNVTTGECRDLSNVHLIKFYPHDAFRFLVNAKEQAFQESEKSTGKQGLKKK